MLPFVLSCGLIFERLDVVISFGVEDYSSVIFLPVLIVRNGIIHLLFNKSHLFDVCVLML